MRNILFMLLMSDYKLLMSLREQKDTVLFNVNVICLTFSIGELVGVWGIKIFDSSGISNNSSKLLQLHSLSFIEVQNMFLTSTCPVEVS